MSEPDGLLEVSVSVSRKINLGNYESADLFVSISKVTKDTPKEEMEAALAQGRMAYELVKRQVRQQVEAVRKRQAQINSDMK